MQFHYMSCSRVSGATTTGSPLIINYWFVGATTTVSAAGLLQRIVQFHARQSRPDHSSSVDALGDAQLHVGGQHRPRQAGHVLAYRGQQRLSRPGHPPGEYDHIRIHQAADVDAEQRELLGGLQMRIQGG